MALQFSVAVRNARLDAIEAQAGASVLIRFYSGSVPANAAASIGASVLLAEITAPSDWMAAASGGSKAKSGTWEDLTANATGTCTYFRVYDSSGTTCHIQGTVGTAGTDMTVGTTSFVTGYKVTVNTFTITDGNA